MIKYTILYKNGKTWNGKAETRADIMEYCWNLIKQKRDVLHVTWIETDGGISVVWPRLSYTGAPTLASSILCSDHYNIKPTRAPNPASKTKKQKAFDKAYARWVRDWHLRGSSDITMQAYKKWLWEQKQVELKNVLKDTSLGEFVKVDVSHGDVVEVYTNGEIKYVTVKGEDGWIPWRGGECPVPANTKVWVKWKGSRKPHFTDDPQGHRWKQYGSFYDIVAYKLFNEPIKTTYTFWLGAFGEISDE